MSHALAFDTLAYAKKLKEAGVPQKQSEIHAEALAEIIDERLATKQDLKELEMRLKQDLKELEMRLKQDLKELEMRLKQDILDLRGDMKEMEMRLTIRLGAMLTAGIVIVAALVKLL